MRISKYRRLTNDLLNLGDYFYDELSDTIYGNENGYIFAIQRFEKQKYMIQLSCATEEKEAIQDEIEIDADLNEYLVEMGKDKYGIMIIVDIPLDTGAKILHSFLLFMTGFFRENGWFNCSETSGTLGETEPYLLGNSIYLLNEEDYKKIYEEKVEESKNQFENRWAGILCILIAMIIIFIGAGILNVLNIFNYVIPIVAGVTLSRSYVFLSGHFSTFGKVISAIALLILVMLYVQFNWAYLFWQYYSVDLYTAFFHYYEYVFAGYVNVKVFLIDLLFNLVISYFFFFVEARNVSLQQNKYLKYRKLSLK